jgi:hypothetical protein
MEQWSKHMSGTKFNIPCPNWVPLARGPFVFRRSRFGIESRAGSTDEELCQPIDEFGTCDFRIAPNAGTFSFRPYARKLAILLYPDDMTDEFRLMANLHIDEAHAFALIDLFDCMREEFRNAVDDGICDIYARYGNPVAPEFTRIPADVFHRCMIRRWGGELTGQGEVLLDETMLYSVYAVPVAVAKHDERRGRRPKLDWDGQVKEFLFDQMDFHGGLVPGDPEWNCQADVERAVTTFIENDLGSSASEGTIRQYTRKFLREWREQQDGN